MPINAFSKLKMAGEENSKTFDVLTIINLDNRVNEIKQHFNLTNTFSEQKPYSNP